MSIRRRLQTVEQNQTAAERAFFRLSRGEPVEALTDEELTAATSLPESQWLKSISTELLGKLCLHFSQLPEPLILALPAAYTVGLETFENALASLRRAIEQLEKHANV